ncbi:hypothetical protein RclHR1_34330001, partial [Rhizophagus clarus]
GVRSI